MPTNAFGFTWFEPSPSSHCLRPFVACRPRPILSKACHPYLLDKLKTLPTLCNSQRFSRMLLESFYERFPLNVCLVVWLGNLKHRRQLSHYVSLNIGLSRNMVNLNFIKLSESSLGLLLYMVAALLKLSNTYRWLVSQLVENHPY